MNRSNDARFVIQALKLLAEGALKWQARSQLINADGMRIVLKFMDKSRSNPEIVCWCAASLATMALAGGDHLMDLFNLGGWFETRLLLKNSTDPQILEYSLLLFSCLLQITNVDTMRKFLDEGGVDMALGHIEES